MNAIEELADRLRTLRAQAGLSGKELAEASGWAQSKVSRLQNGEQMPTAVDIDIWARACGADAATEQELLHLLEDAEDWRRKLRHGQLATQASYTQLVARSSLVRHFETVFVPGLLQTPEYARRIFTEMADLHGSDVDDIDAALAARMQRQQFIYDTGKRFEFLLAEPVLRWLLCPRDVMRSQLDRLQTVVGLPNVRFGILPLGVELARIPQNSFQVYDDVAMVETFIGEQTHRDNEAAAYVRVMEQMWGEAATGDDARRLLVRAVADLT